MSASATRPTQLAEDSAKSHYPRHKMDQIGKALWTPSGSATGSEESLAQAVEPPQPLTRLRRIHCHILVQAYSSFRDGSTFLFLTTPPLCCCYFSFFFSFFLFFWGVGAEWKELTVSLIFLKVFCGPPFYCRPRTVCGGQIDPLMKEVLSFILSKPPMNRIARTLNSRTGITIEDPFSSRKIHINFFAASR